MSCRRRRSERPGALALLLTGCSLVAGCALLPQRPVAAPSPVVPSPAAPSPVVPVPGAQQLLGTLRVQGRAPLTGYDREAFGQPWADADRNGCDTRNDVLRRDLTAVEVKPGTRDCVVLRGLLVDPYTGERVDHVRGGGGVEVDHVVSLADAWQKGASGWPWAKRVALANDPLDLLATATSVNRVKGAGDAATWLPPLRSARCAFAARQVAVKAKYGLAVTRAERDALARLLAACPDQPVPTSSAPTLAPLRSPAARP